MRKFFPILFLLISGTVLAGNGQRRNISDTINEQLNYLKNILLSAEWQPVDSNSCSKIFELVNFIENSPIDSVLINLKQEVDSSSLFFTREIANIKDTDKVKGYIRAEQMNKTLTGIDKTVAEKLPLESIVVPEDQFVGIYSKLPLITYANMDRLIADSIVSYPDSLLLLMAGNTHGKKARKSKQTDSLVTRFLNQARKSYNDSLINHFRDSVTNRYRVEFQKHYADSLKKSYTDSIARINRYALTAYNDSVSVLVNQKFRENLKSLITYVNRIPNDVVIYNFYNESFDLPLQNDGVWYKWIWLKNQRNDSIGIRVENLDKHNIRVLVDETVNLSRLTKRETLEVDKLRPARMYEPGLRKIHTRTPKESPWEFGGKAYAGFTETFINKVWSSGGNSSASALTTFKYEANYTMDNLTWENEIDSKLGLIYYLDEDEDEDVYRNWHKNSDNLNITSKLGYTAFKKWKYSAEAEFQTQFFAGYSGTSDSTMNSSFLSPGYITFSAGLDYNPNKNFSLFLSPLSLKTTIVTNGLVDETSYDIEEGKKIKTRIGITNKINYSKDVTENLSIETDNTIFINYGYNDGEWQFIKIPDFDSETTLDFKINQFVSTQVNFHFVYDKDVESTWEDNEGVEHTGVRLQVKQFLTLGVSYSF